jgi:hypothetical protein
VYANYDGGKAAGTLSEAEEKLGGIPCTSCTHLYNITKLLLHNRSRSFITLKSLQVVVRCCSAQHFALSFCWHD